MEGVLDLYNGEWVIRFKYDDGPLTLTSYVPLSTFSKIMCKGELYVDANVEFKITKEEKHISRCKCTDDNYDKCEHFVRNGINDCLTYDVVEKEVGTIQSIEPKREPINQTFDRKLVEELLIEVKNRFSVMGPDNYISDFTVIDWFNRNYPQK